MDHTISRERDVEFDLESGGNSTSEDDSSTDHCLSDRDSNDDSNYNYDHDRDDDNLELLVEKGSDRLPHLNNHDNNNKKKKSSNPRKPSKPPLPPNGPSLIAGDQKFVKELSELALRKRARIKRMKAVRKMKATNKSAAALSSSSSSPSSCSTVSALIFTVFFFLVMIFHGIRSANSDVDRLTASPEVVTPTEEDLISVQYPKKFITNKVSRERR